MEKIDAFLSEIRGFLEKEVEPMAHLLDHDPDLLAEKFDALKNLNVLKLHIPANLGGLGATRSDFVKYNMLLAEYSGALLFLQAQHQFVMRRLSSDSDSPKVQKIFKQVVETDKGYGVYFAVKKKLLRVFKDERGGFLISGTLPWVTGYGFHSNIFMGFIHEDHKYATHIPFEEIDQDGASIHLSAPKDVSVFESVNTVEVTLNSWYIPESEIILKEGLIDSGQKSEHPAIYNFAGVAGAFLKQVTKSNKHKLPAMKEAHLKLQSHLDNYIGTIEKDLPDPEVTRAWGLKLAKDCAQLAQLAWGGVGLLSDHPVERLTRELTQYSIAGLTASQIDHYLKMSG